jgi:hypothetical protein
LGFFREKKTHQFQLVQMVLSLSPVPLKTGTHIHARPDHRDGLVEPLGNEGVVHLAFRDRLLAFHLASLDEL